MDAKKNSVKKCEENKVQQRTKEKERVENSAAVVKEKFICPRLCWDRDQAFEDSSSSQQVDAQHPLPLFDMVKLRAVMASLEEGGSAPLDLRLSQVPQLLVRQRLRIRVVNGPEDIDHTNVVRPLDVDWPPR